MTHFHSFLWLRKKKELKESGSLTSDYTSNQDSLVMAQNQRYGSMKQGRKLRDKLVHLWSPNHVWMWELDCEEGWATKNWCFWTVVLEKTLESPLDCKEIRTVHSEGDESWGSLEGLMLKLKLQYFGHLMWRVDSLEKTLMLGKTEGRKRRGQQRMRWLYGIPNAMDMSEFK